MKAAIRRGRRRVVYSGIDVVEEQDPDISSSHSASRGTSGWAPYSRHRSRDGIASNQMDAITVLFVAGTIFFQRSLFSKTHNINFILSWFLFFPLMGLTIRLFTRHLW